MKLTTATSPRPSVHRPTTGDPQIGELHPEVTESQFLLPRDSNAGGTSGGEGQNITHVNPVQFVNACQLSVTRSLGPIVRRESDATKELYTLEEAASTGSSYIENSRH